VLLDANRDGIEQIAETLQDLEDVDAIHVFSHGVNGAVELGSSWLNAFSLEARAEIIAEWGKALTQNGDSFSTAAI